jgi:hypothetical protein
MRGSFRRENPGFLRERGKRGRTESGTFVRTIASARVTTIGLVGCDFMKCSPQMGDLGCATRPSELAPFGTVDGVGRNSGRGLGCATRRRSSRRSEQWTALVGTVDEGSEQWTGVLSRRTERIREFRARFIHSLSTPQNAKAKRQQRARSRRRTTCHGAKNRKKPATKRRSRRVTSGGVSTSQQALTSAPRPPQRKTCG